MKGVNTGSEPQRYAAGTTVHHHFLGTMAEFSRDFWILPEVEKLLLYVSSPATPKKLN